MLCELARVVFQWAGPARRTPVPLAELRIGCSVRLQSSQRTLPER